MITTAVKFPEETGFCTAMACLPRAAMAEFSLPRVIALVGKMGAGKDTVAAYLADRYGYDHEKLAAPLKRSVQALFGWTDAHVEDHALKDRVDAFWGVSPRTVMQKFGTEIVQYEFDARGVVPGVGRRFFVKSLLHRIRDKELVVVSDVRFEHEASALREHCDGCLVVRIHRPPLRQQEQGREHVSETESDDIRCDVQLLNDADVEHLHRSVDCMLTNLMR